MANHDVLIKHGLFRYYAPESQVIDGADKEVLVERMAFHNERVTLTRDSDYERGVRYGAFWTEDEARAHYGELGIPAPGLGQAPAAPAAASEDEHEVELTDLDEDELVDWLMSTGQFDGNPKPTVQQVVEAGNEGGPEFAAKLHAAETRASGDAPRQGVVDGLSKVAA